MYLASMLALMNNKPLVLFLDGSSSLQRPLLCSLSYTEVISSFKQTQDYGKHLVLGEVPT
jgi:hypothetical protein